MKTIITLVILISVSIITQMINFLPWWFFLAPVFLLGMLLPLGKWKVWSFFWGFISGVIVWTCSTIYFEVTFDGEIIKNIGKLIDLNDYLIYTVIGALGGTLTGLSFYSGYLLRKGREVLNLDLPDGQ